MYSSKKIRNWHLYVITDERLSGGRTHVEVAKAAIAGGADVIQLRDKTVSGRELFEIGLKIRKLTTAAGATFIVNDRLDIAFATNADGLHVGQDDLPAKIAKKILGPDKILGVSARNFAEALQAEKDGADYLGLGPIYEARGTKPDTIAPQNVALIFSVREKCRIPIVAIGGINYRNVSEVIAAGADCAAVISAIVSAENIQAATQKIKEIILAVKELGANSHGHSKKIIIH